MARISIVHTTEYSYRNPVGLLRHKLMVRPDESHDLRLHRATLKVEPEPTGVYWKHDVFNNSICFLEWPEALRTRQLSIVSTLDMTHHPDGQPLPVYSLDTAADLFPFSYNSHEIPDLARLAERQMPDPDRKVDAWARRVVSDTDSKQTLKVLEAMTHAIKAEFRYSARYEEGTQTAVQTLALGSGTCRDFAVLMMEALRSFGLATRFVTGYLYDDSSARPGRRQHARLVQRLSAWCRLGRIRPDERPGCGGQLVRVGVTREAGQALPISVALSGMRTIRPGCTWTSRSVPYRSNEKRIYDTRAGDRRSAISQPEGTLDAAVADVDP